jgi:ABC-type transport system involved in Fe-S cluster assembly fused permease/ATPase subunit
MEHSSAAKGLPALEALRYTLHLLWGESDAYARRRFVLSFIFMVCVSGLGALTPVAYKLLIDGLTQAGSVSALLTPTVLVLGYVACQYLARVLGELRGLAHGQGVQRLDRRLSNRMFGHIIRLPLSYHLERKTGAIGETLGQGLSGCQTLLQHLVFTFLPIVVEFGAMTLVLVHFGHSGYLAILGAAAVAYLFAFTHATRSIVQPSEAMSDAHIEVNATLTDSLLNYETVKYFGGEGAVSGSFDGATRKQETAVRRLLRLRVVNGLVVATIFTASLGSSLVLAGAEVLSGAMTLGDFVLINTYVARLVQPLEVIGFAIRDVSQGLAFLRRMLEMFREKAELDGEAGDVRGGDEQGWRGEDGGAAGVATVVGDGGQGRGLDESPGSVAGELRFENVSLAYRPDRAVLRDVSFSVPAGKTVAIVGASGSGKSSLIRLLFRMYEPDKGRITLDGVPISQWPLPVLRKAIAVVPQDTVLFNDSLARNIAFGRIGATAEEIASAARVAHLDQLIASLPEGYDTPVGERGLKLSGGEKQRVAIARAALKRPRIFVFDEATSSLDSRTEREILENLVEVARGSTTIVIAHRLSTIVHADQIVVLQGGTVVERGTHAELLAGEGAYAVLWKAQQGGSSGSGSADSSGGSSRSGSLDSAADIRPEQGSVAEVA